jgi:hypothetical protein
MLLIASSEAIPGTCTEVPVLEARIPPEAVNTIARAKITFTVRTSDQSSEFVFADQSTFLFGRMIGSRKTSV